MWMTSCVQSCYELKVSRSYMCVSMEIIALGGVFDICLQGSSNDTLLPDLEPMQVRFTSPDNLLGDI